MSKRYIRLDIEYDSEGQFSWGPMNLAKRSVENAMPFAKVFFSRDSPNREGLNQDNHEVERIKK